MVRLLILLVSCCSLAITASAVEQGATCAFSVSQYDPDQSRDVLLFADTADLLVGVPTIGSMVAFSLDIEIQNIDSSAVSFLTHVVTFGIPPNNYSHQYKVEYGAPARLANIQGKQDVQYTLEITPIEPTEIDTTNCAYLHTKGDYFKSDPSAHLDIYFVPQTYGDFYWNSVKGMMEQEYRRFRDLNQFNVPGKYSLYLCPCPIYSVIWDKRFGMVVDPTRSTMFSIYHKDVNTTYPFIVLHASILKNYGYAPPFLSEGYAGYLSDAPLVIKEMHESGKLVPLHTLLSTYNYFTADPVVADRMAATFVRYLIEKYKIDPFLDLYRRANDLNLEASIEQVYDKPVDELEQEWLHYIDTLTVKFSQFLYYSNQAETMFDYQQMLKLAKRALDVANRQQDSAYALAQVVRGSFFTGDYYGATEYQKQIIALDSTTAKLWMALGSYQMMNGYYDQGLENLERARSLDTVDQTILFNIALNYQIRGDDQAAKDLLSTVVRFPTQTAPLPESQIMLGNILMNSDDPDERVEGLEYYRKAVDLLGRSVRTHNPSAQQQLWNGIAHLGLGETDAAWTYLQTARYLETRPFYLGFINLWLGKAADVRDDRQVARRYYGAVLAEASAAYHQTEARKYLEQPYRQ